MSSLLWPLRVKYDPMGECSPLPSHLGMNKLKSLEEQWSKQRAFTPGGPASFPRGPFLGPRDVIANKLSSGSYLDL
jgi:hypothetical protein